MTSVNANFNIYHLIQTKIQLLIMAILFIIGPEWLLAYIFIGCIRKEKYYPQTN